MSESAPTVKALDSRLVPQMPPVPMGWRRSMWTEHGERRKKVSARWTAKIARILNVAVVDQPFEDCCDSPDMSSAVPERSSLPAIGLAVRLKRSWSIATRW